VNIGTDPDLLRLRGDEVGPREREERDDD